jgi:uncharacterized surface protein with fasciclin (FAS1) repeats
MRALGFLVLFCSQLASGQLETFENSLGTLLEETPELSKLSKLVALADLTAVFEDPTHEVTVFAPSNDAFDKFGAKQWAYFSDPDNIDELQQLLKYHITVGTLSTDNMAISQSVQTVGGKYLTVSSENGVVTVGDARVSASDMDASNGILHIVDSVLIPSGLVPTPEPTFAAATYGCVFPDFTCEPSENGQFASLEDCETTCTTTAAPSPISTVAPTAAPSKEPKYACSYPAMQCSPNADGEFADLASCEVECAETPSPVPAPTTEPTLAPTDEPKYGCSYPAMECRPTPHGQFDDVISCKEECKSTLTPTFAPTITPTLAPTKEPRYGCSYPAMQCRPSLNGEFEDITSCEAECKETTAPTLAPSTLAPTMVPTPRPTQQPTLAPSELATLVPTGSPTVGLFDCLYPQMTCHQSESGRFTNKEGCDSRCETSVSPSQAPVVTEAPKNTPQSSTPYFDCLLDSGVPTCHPSSIGPFATSAACQSMCKEATAGATTPAMEKEPTIDPDVKDTAGAAVTGEEGGEEEGKAEEEQEEEEQEEAQEEQEKPEEEQEEEKQEEEEEEEEEEEDTGGKGGANSGVVAVEWRVVDVDCLYIKN